MLQNCNKVETITYFTHFSGFVNPPAQKGGREAWKKIEKSPIYG